jgi:hypothetical protein
MSARTDTEAVARSPVVSVPRLAPLFFLAGVALVPWTIYLFATLPGRHVQSGYYDLAWGGFDAALAAILVATGYGLLRWKRWTGTAAAAAATMLLCDAWFDVLTAGGDGERFVAVVLAAALEVPAAVVCLLIARAVEDEHARLG